MDQLTSTSWIFAEAIITGVVNLLGGLGSMEAEITAELISKASPLSLYALTRKQENSSRFDMLIISFNRVKNCKIVKIVASENVDYRINT